MAASIDNLGCCLSVTVSANVMLQAVSFAGCLIGLNKLPDVRVLVRVGVMAVIILIKCLCGNGSGDVFDFLNFCYFVIVGVITDEAIISVCISFSFRSWELRSIAMLNIAVKENLIIPVIDYDSVFINLCCYSDCCVALNAAEFIGISVSFLAFKGDFNSVALCCGENRIGLSVTLAELNSKNNFAVIVGYKASVTEFTACFFVSALVGCFNNVNGVFIDCC